jgi:hypothetical protein
MRYKGSFRSLCVKPESLAADSYRGGHKVNFFIHASIRSHYSPPALSGTCTSVLEFLFLAFAVFTPHYAPISNPKMSATSGRLMHRRIDAWAIQPVRTDRPSRGPRRMQGQLEPATAPTRAAKTGPFQMGLALHDNNFSKRHLVWRWVSLHKSQFVCRSIDEPDINEYRS